MRMRRLLQCGETDQLRLVALRSCVPAAPAAHNRETLDGPLRISDGGGLSSGL